MNTKVNAQNAVEYISKNPLPKISIISGAEILINQENADALRKKALAEGYTERRRIDAPDRANTAAASWRELQLEYESPSLFADKRLIEFVGGQKTLDKHATAIIENISKKNSNEIILIIQLANLEKESKIAGVLELHSNTLTQQEYEFQIQKRLKKAGISLTSSAYEKFLDYHEGNLLAAQQSINRLRQYPDHKDSLNEQEIKERLSDFARFGAQDFANALIAADWIACYRVAEKLEASDKGILELINWQIRTQMNTILQLLSRPQNERQNIFQSAVPPIYYRRQAVFISNLAKWTPQLAIATLHLSAKIDRISKGAAAGNAWQTLRQYCLLRAEANTHK
ncbi:MAG: DNA polymerase III subunit delta [Cardiobacteriaceae bacterium]|nr:DNA polymerase III subunit delta [Cardiobacteriaceae bacterium]